MSQVPPNITTHTQGGVEVKVKVEVEAELEVKVEVLHGGGRLTYLQVLHVLPPG